MVNRASSSRNAEGWWMWLRWSVYCFFVWYALIYNFHAIIPAKEKGGYSLSQPLEWLAVPFADSAKPYYEGLLDNREKYQEGKLPQNEKNAASDHTESLDNASNGRSTAPSISEGETAQRSDPPLLAEEIPENTSPQIETDSPLENNSDMDLLLQDVFRVTCANIILVVSLSAFLGFLTIGSPREVRRKWFDSLYFFGFMLTLLALILALGNISRFSQVQLPIIIVQNAIALTSTVVALICRTILVLSIAVEDDDENPFDDLYIHISNLAQSLVRVNEATTQFGVKLRRAQGIVDSTGQQVGTSVEKLVKRFSERAEDLSEIQIDQELIAKQMASAAKLALEKVDAEIKSLQTTLKSGSSNIDQNTKRLVHAIAATTKAFDTGASNAADGAQQISSAMSESAQQIGSASAAFASGLGKAVEDASSAITASTTDAMTKIVEANTTAQNDISTAAKAAGQKISDSASANAEKLDAAFETVKTRISSATAEGAESFNTAFKSMTGKMTELDISALVQKRLGDLLDSVAEQINARQREFSASLVEAMSAVQESTEKQRDVTKGLEGLFQQIDADQQRLSSLSNALGDLQTRVQGIFLDPTWHTEQSRRLDALRASNIELKRSLDQAMRGFQQFFDDRPTSPSLAARNWTRIKKLFRGSS